MNVAFRVDASTEMGTGHVMRCLTLADELQRSGAHTRFVARSLPDHLERLLRDTGHELARLPPVVPEAGEGAPLEHARWLGASQPQDAAQTLKALSDEKWDWLVVDHYGLDARWETRLRTCAARILCFDDLADRDHDCDVLLDQNIQAVPYRYHGRVPQDCVLLLGTPYVQLRPQFAAMREQLLNSARPARLHVFMGGTDPESGTVLALSALALLPTMDADVVLGEDCPSRPHVEALCRHLPGVTLHIQVRDMASLLARATLALGAGGSASWERCCFGVPTLVMSFAENQRPGCRALAAARAAIDLGDLGSLTPEGVARLLGQARARTLLLGQMGRRAARLVDGAGAGRVAGHMREAMTSGR